ncbi:craniofacial development protein 2-like [Ctenocephalides felis]|uniref:craniofacial development protein 2-like n=1 Tax=Ctenocephalides felis TaxID=7515 RepID=UPI000E6E37AE|nr:craniofacial development protein 2-like [Ctenocephalides felis]
MVSMMAFSSVKYSGVMTSRSHLRVKAMEGEAIESSHKTAVDLPFRLATWNVRTMMRAGKLENLKRKMNKCKVGVVGLSEVRWQGQGETKSNGFTMYHSGGDKSERGGAVMVRNKSVRSVLNVNCLSDRLMSVKMKAEPVDVMVVQVYMPTSSHDEAQVEQIYEQIDEMLYQEGKGKVNVVIMGDFNAIVGKGSEKKIVGKYGLGRRNDRGNMLIDFCRRNNLMITNTRFKNRKTKLYTWKSPGDSERYQIDYIIVKNRFRNSVKDVKTFPGADIDSDHNLFTAVLETKLKNMRKTGNKDRDGIWKT